MPIINNLTVSSIRAANTTMTTSFFQRYRELVFPKICGSTTSTSRSEPFAFYGAAPSLRVWNGVTPQSGFPSYFYESPNILFKSGSSLSRTEFEFDQTGMVVKIAGQFGAMLANHPEFVFIWKLLKGHTNESAYNRAENGIITPATFETGIPFFSGLHNIWSGGNQSNIFQGSVPSTVAAVAAQSVATTAQQIQQDVQRAVQKLKTFKDNRGNPIHPSLDCKSSVVVLVPPALETAAKLALLSTGALINQTTNVTPLFVKDVYSSGMLESCNDVFSDNPDAQLTPANETDYYIFVVNDNVKPMYQQIFTGLPENRTMPIGYNPEAVADRLVKSFNVPVPAAQSFASTMVETTFNEQGENASAYTIQNEAFLISARWRGNFNYGFWPNAIKVVPSGGVTSSSGT